jgi:ribosomal protein S17E
VRRWTLLTSKATQRMRKPWGGGCFQGRVRTKTVKKASRQIIEKYYSRLTLDFATNKRMAEEVAIIPSKRLRNKIAGFTTVWPKPATAAFVHGQEVTPWRLLCHSHTRSSLWRPSKGSTNLRASFRSRRGTGGAMR